ncbi:MAG: ribosome biogenesis GTPase Der [Rickettsiales bacterium]
MTIKIAILGKPNVGKSTIFNKLCGRRLAITHDKPGVTRDAKSYMVTLEDKPFEFIDTAGLEKSKAELSQNMVKSSLNAAKQADLIIFTIDARQGIDHDDKDFARKIHKLGKKVILVANKSESRTNLDFTDLFKLGFGEPLAISAEHNIGLDDLRLKMVELTKDVNISLGDEEESQYFKVAIVGRPNVGKSTIFNNILGFERVITSEISGTTRDAISHIIEHDGEEIELIDTAGMRKKAKVQEIIESLSTFESINAIRRAHAVALVIDATQPLEKQDLTIAHVIINEGRAVVLVVNKIDKIENLNAYKDELNYLISKNLNAIKDLPVVYLSAIKEHRGSEKIFRAIAKARVAWETEISTGKLNKWSEYTTGAHLPPIASNGRRFRVKYVTQTGIRPPTFTAFVNITKDFPDSYIQYLSNQLRDDFKLYGTPIRVRLKKVDNPYATLKKK